MSPFQIILLLILTYSQTNARLFRSKCHLSSPETQVYSIKLTYKPLSLTTLNLLSKTHAKLQNKSQYLQFHKQENTSLLTKSLLSFKPQVTLTKKNAHPILKLKNFENTQYIGSLTIGTPGQTIPVIYDTGSSFTWVNSDRCNTVNCQRMGTFNRKSSSTYKSKELTQVFEFGSGKLLAQLAEESLELPGIQVDEFEFYEILNQKGRAFNNAKFAGIVGLGVADPDQKAGGIKPLIDLILPKLNKGVFSVYLSRQTGPSSEIMLGGFKEEYSINYFQVDSTDHYWSVELEDVFLRGSDGTNKMGICENGCKAVLDTGTSYLTGPEQPLQQLLEGIDVQPQCQNFDELPNLVYQIGGEEYELEPWEYTFTVDQNGKVNEIYQKNDQIYGCLGAFIPLNLNIKEKDGWILGDIFISKFPVVYDKKNMQIGIQKKNKQ